VAAAAVLALVPTWSREPSFAARAMAALGADRYLRVEVVPPSARYSAVVDVASGRTRPADVKRVYWYDSRTSTFRVWDYVDGLPVASGDLAGGNVGLAAFLGGYRAALADGSAELVGRTKDRGRDVEIVRFDASVLVPAPSICAGACTRYTPGTMIDVAVDRSSYRPVWFRLSGQTRVGGATKTGSIFRIVEIRGAATTAARPRDVPQLLGQAIDTRRVTRAQAAEALGRMPLWPVAPGGLALRSAEIQRLESYPDVTAPLTSAGPGLHLRFGKGPRAVEIRESAKPEPIYGFMSPARGGLGPVAPAGSIRIGCVACGRGLDRPTWAGQFRVGGFYVDLTASSRSLLLATARALMAASGGG
jgi:hypothetical protein